MSKMNNIYLFKLTSGEEVIARTSEEIVNYNRINTVLIRNPMMLQFTPQGIGAMPWMVAAEDDQVTLIGSSITAISKVKAEVEKLYLQQVSGIDLSVPSTSSLAI